MTSAIHNQAMWRPILWLAVVGALWGLIERLGMGIAETYSFSQIVFMRYAVHILILVAACSLLRVPVIVRSRRPLAHISLGICMWVMPASFILAGTNQTNGNLWSAFWVMPILVLILAALFLGDRMTVRNWIIVITAYFGSMLVLGADAFRVSPATFIPVIGGLSFAVYVVLLRFLRDEPVTTALFYTGLIPMLGMVPMMAAVWEPIATADLWKILSIGLVSLIILFSLERAMSSAAPSFAAPFLYGAVVSELLIELLRSGALPDVSQIVGSVILLLVVVSAVLVGRNASVQHG